MSVMGKVVPVFELTSMDEIEILLGPSPVFLQVVDLELDIGIHPAGLDWGAVAGLVRRMQVGRSFLQVNSDDLGFRMSFAEVLHKVSDDHKLGDINNVPRPRYRYRYHNPEHDARSPSLEVRCRGFRRAT